MAECPEFRTRYGSTLWDCTKQDPPYSLETVRTGPETYRFHATVLVPGKQLMFEVLPEIIAAGKNHDVNLGTSQGHYTAECRMGDRGPELFVEEYLANAQGGVYHVDNHYFNEGGGFVRVRVPKPDSYSPKPDSFSCHPHIDPGH